jgi:hypothetical protein
VDEHYENVHQQRWVIRAQASSWKILLTESTEYKTPIGNSQFQQRVVRTNSKMMLGLKPVTCGVYAETLKLQSSMPGMTMILCDLGTP